MPAWRDAGAEARAAVCVEIVDRDQRAVVRDRQRRDAHQRPAVRDVVPGRRPARPGPRARGDRRRAGRAGARAGLGASGRSPAAGRAAPACRRTTAIVPARRRAGHRLQHLPDVERYPGPLRLAGHRQRRSSSSRTRAPCCRWRSASRSRGRSLEAAGFDPDLVQLAPEADGEQLAKDAGRARRGARSSTTPAARPSARWLEREGGRPRQAGLHREGRASTRSSSTRPTTCAACWATWPSRSRSTPARCARRRRTSTCPATASTPTRATCPSRSSAPRLADARQPAHRRRRQGGRAARRDGQRRRARPGRRRCAELAAKRRRHRSSSTRRRVAHPTYPDAVVRTPGLVAVDVGARTGLHAGVLRAGRVPHRHGRHGAVAAGCSATRSASTAR